MGIVAIDALAVAVVPLASSTAHLPFVEAAAVVGVDNCRIL